MLEIEHWKTAFFGLPKEVPLLVKPGEPLNAHLRNYDFNQGMQAMVIFLTLRPKDPQAGAYRRFLKKWPAYQSFFKSVDAHDFTAAARSLAEVQALDPAEPAVWFYQGSLSTQTGDYAEAEKDYRAYINLARLAKRRGAANEAKTVLQEALQHVTPDEQKSSRLTVQAMLADLEKP
jgi:tetratricopeptide (TPR) repeat protein